MVLCRYFLQGNCRFGSKCHNDHFDLKQILKTDIDAAINGKQWPFTCYGPFKDKPSIPNFIEDRSFEEVRYMCYEAKKQNFFEQFHQQFTKEAIDTTNKIKALLQSPGVIDIVAKLHDAPEQGQTVGAAPGGNPFGLAAVSSSVSGGSLFAKPAAPSAGNIFGGAVASNTNSIFGGVGNAAGGTSLFGQQTVQQQPSIFGGGMQQPQQQTSIFTQQSNAMGPIGGSSVFGQSNTSNAVGGGNIFAQAQQVTASGFGGGIFAQAAHQTSNLFAQQQQQPTLPQQQQMTNAANPFAQQTAPPNANIFGQQPTTAAGGVLFGQAAPAPAGNIFVQAAQAPSAGIFGNPTAPVTQSPFGQPQQQQQVQQMTSNMFGQQQAVGMQPAAQPQPSQIDFSVYSKMEDLSADDIQAFTAPSFEPGKLPFSPPPFELINYD